MSNTQVFSPYCSFLH